MLLVNHIMVTYGDHNIYLPFVGSRVAGQFLLRRCGSGLFLKKKTNKNVDIIIGK